MTDTKPPIPNLHPLTQEQLDKIGGGDCTPAEWIQIFEDLKENYETLVDFTSYVIERVVTSTSGN
jgi:hypothetical protein